MKFPSHLLYQKPPTMLTVYKNMLYKLVPSWLVMFMKHNMEEMGSSSMLITEIMVSTKRLWNGQTVITH